MRKTIDEHKETIGNKQERSEKQQETINAKQMTHVFMHLERQIQLEQQNWHLPLAMSFRTAKMCSRGSESGEIN